MNPCREWSEILRSNSGAKFWRWAYLRVDLQWFPDQAENLLTSRLISIIPEIVILPAGTHQNTENSLLELINDGETSQLKKLTFAGEVPHVTPNIVAGAAMRLETLWSYLSRPQLEAVLARLAAHQDSRLWQLRVFGKPLKISTLDPEVLAAAFVKLETVGFDLTDGLSTGQLSALFSRICQSQVLRLTELYLFNKDLSLVPPEVLVGAIQRLEIVEFGGGRMTAEQAIAILTIVKERRLGKIKKIMIKSVEGMRSVTPSLLQEAKLNAKFQEFFI